MNCSALSMEKTQVFRTFLNVEVFNQRSAFAAHSALFCKGMNAAVLLHESAFVKWLRIKRFGCALNKDGKEVPRMHSSQVLSLISNMRYVCIGCRHHKFCHRFSSMIYVLYDLVHLMEFQCVDRCSMYHLSLIHISEPTRPY